MRGARKSVLMRFTFVRHGETLANKNRCIQGHADIPLCENGEQQATRAGERLRDVRFTRVYASDLCRAAHTCQLIVAQNTRHPPPIIIDKRLRERNFGSVEGMSFDEVLKMAEAIGSSWPHYNPPGAETVGDLQARLVAFFKEVCQSIYDKTNYKMSKSKASKDSQKAAQELTPNGTQNQENEEKEAEVEEENLRNEAKEREEEERRRQETEARRAVEGEGETNTTKDEDDNGKDEEGDDEGEHVLVVSHGAALRQLYTHLHRTLACPLPPNAGPDDPVTRLSPNTAVSQYTVRYSPKSYIMQCLCIHDNRHNEGM